MADHGFLHPSLHPHPDPYKHFPLAARRDSRPPERGEHGCGKVDAVYLCRAPCSPSPLRAIICYTYIIAPWAGSGSRMLTK